MTDEEQFELEGLDDSIGETLVRVFASADRVYNQSKSFGKTERLAAAVKQLCLVTRAALLEVEGLRDRIEQLEGLVVP